MNLFSKALFFGILFLASTSWAINVRTVYISACKREIGVIVGMNDHNLEMLNIEGRVKTIPRHNVIFLADYPMDALNVNGRVDLASVPQVVAYTRKGNRIVRLVSGWPINFSKEKIAFLTKSGKEIVIDRKNIWQIEFKKVSKKLSFKKSSAKYKFVPPYSFRDCVDKYSRAGNRTIYPQQVLANPIVIKRELDEIQKGHEKIQEYHREQDFYPVPIIYKTVTSVGIWHNISSRNGSSDKRPSNFLPFIKDSYMSDVFDYQHRFITGSHPMHFSVHEESQTQAYYNFKDSYFHFTAMVDPNVILIGAKNYAWQDTDFTQADDRLNESSYFEMGFDFGHFSFGFANNGVSLGGFDGSTFDTMVIPLSGLVLYYQNHLFKIEGSFKSGSTTETKSSTPTNTNTTLDVQRVNVYFTFVKKFELSYSLINRNLKLNDHLNYKSQTLINAAYADYKLSDKYTLGGYFSIENQSITSNASATRLNPKFGGYMSISF